MSLNDFAKHELELAGYLSAKDDFYGGKTGEAVLELIEVFSKQEHSAMSADLVVNLFWKLANRKTLSPITGDNSEWQEVESVSSLQNKRCPGLWKNESGEVSYSAAIVFVEPNGISWRGAAWLSTDDSYNNLVKISSTQKIKGFPFTPKTFTIEVEQVEIAEEITPVIKDKQKLQEALGYYNG